MVQRFLNHNMKKISLENFFLAQKAVAPETYEAFSIDIETKAYPSLVVNVTSLTPTALGKFRSFITSIPVIGGKILFLDE